MKGRKDDGTDGKCEMKDRWDLVPWDALQLAVKVLTFGAKEYDDENWKYVDGGEERYFAALLRHLTDYRLGNKVDAKSKLPTLACVIVNAMFLLWMELHGDDSK